MISEDWVMSKHHLRNGKQSGKRNDRYELEQELALIISSSLQVKVAIGRRAIC